MTATMSTAAGSVYITWTVANHGRPPEPPTGVLVPAPEPFPPGPLPWAARRLDAPAELVAS